MKYRGFVQVEDYVPIRTRLHNTAKEASQNLRELVLSLGNHPKESVTIALLSENGRVLRSFRVTLEEAKRQAALPH